MSRSHLPVRAVFALATAFAVAATILPAADNIKGAGDFDPKHETVEIFSAMDQGLLEVRVIPRDESQCRVLITNLSDKPVNVQMPDVLAAVPVLAQFGPGQVRMGGMRQQQQPQGLGLGNPFGNGGNQNGGQFMNGGGGNNLGGGFFNIPPERVAQLRLKSVCLEHGKPTPRAAMAYALKPLDEASQSDGIQAVCRMLGRGQIGQSTAQAAAWHLCNEKTWPELAAMTEGVFHLARRPFFLPHQLAEARRVVDGLDERPEGTAPAMSLSAR